MIGGRANSGRFQTASTSVDGTVANRSKRISNLEEISVLRLHGRWKVDNRPIVLVGSIGDRSGVDGALVFNKSIHAY
jgi:hypothetical protein